MSLLISEITHVIAILYSFHTFISLHMFAFLLFALAIIMPHPLPASLSLTLKQLAQRLLKSHLYTRTTINTHSIMYGGGERCAQGFGGEA
jgi:hypothetical protein